MTGEDGQPSAFELGQLIGKYDESMKNINGCLGTINRKLDAGNKTMNELQLDNKDIHNDIDGVRGALKTHRDKKHLYKITDEESRMTRTGRHWVEIVLGAIISISTVIIGLKQAGVI
ncbi:MAG: hypothetical protein ACTSSE_08510 [Candidatus Thorarchaeota archaeon]|nr:hypothetical protein [Deltaproteobacteria bacterium]